MQSVLQYVEDLELILKKILSFKPKYILFEDTFLIKKLEYVTIQKYFGINQTFKVHKLEKFMKILFKNNYEKVFWSPQIVSVRGKFQFYDMSNLPNLKQLRHTYCGLFRLKKQ